METQQVEKFKQLFKKFPHVVGRVPYTYHHDYLIGHSLKFKSKSRSEVAALHDSSELELYAIALVELFDTLGSVIICYLEQDDLPLCKEAKIIAIEALKRY